MATVSISKRLLRTVLTSYALLTLVILFSQLFSSYLLTKAEITEEIQQLERTINVSLSQAIWELNDEQIDAIGSGLKQMSFVQAVLIQDENETIIYQSGDRFSLRLSHQQLGDISHDDLFGYLSQLSFSFSGGTTQPKKNPVGYVAVLSDHSIVFNQMKVQVIFSFMSALLSITLISFLIKYLFNKLLTTPLENLSHSIARINLDDLVQAQLNAPTEQKDELFVLTQSFNSMLTKLTEYKDRLEKTKLQLIAANTRLDQQNTLLEDQVSNKTVILSDTVNKLATQKTALEINEQELIKSLEQLKNAQYQLVESEKMASLGGLVAGISHEINTPVGIGVTAVSYLTECLTILERKITTKSLTQTDMNQFLVDAHNCSALLFTNLNRASQLIQSFKDIAVDQTSEAIRDVDLVSYLSEVIVSLQPKFKRSNHQVIINGDSELIVHCRAGAVSQIYTNLILNSLIHAFPDTDDGIIEFHLSHNQHTVFIAYRDDGVGLSSESLERLFEPFYTTRRGQGGSGLGTHILYNVVTQALGGKITARSQLGKGLEYDIEFPTPKIDDVQVHDNDC